MFHIIWTVIISLNVLPFLEHNISVCAIELNVGGYDNRKDKVETIQRRVSKLCMHVIDLSLH